MQKDVYVFIMFQVCLLQFLLRLLTLLYNEAWNCILSSVAEGPRKTQLHRRQTAVPRISERTTVLTSCVVLKIS